ncbi:MAG: glycoside hydrolase family 2, partial [Chitinophagaceae bacterium]
LIRGPQPGFYRAPTDNDIGAGLNTKLRMWRNAYDEKINVVKVEAGQAHDLPYGGVVSVSSSLLNGDATTTQVFYLYADGTIKVETQFKAVKGNYKTLMRIGNDLQLDKNYNIIQWYGRGPGENYIDRKTASLIGTYSSTVDDQYFPYARPQESGNKVDVRWVAFTNKAGKGLRFEFADQLLSFSALPYAVEDLDPEAEKKQYHSGELVKRNQIYVHMDMQQLGVQGIDSWGSLPLVQYQIPFKDYTYSYYIKPIK